MKSNLNTFRIGDACFEHTIDTETDATHFTVYDEREVMRIDSSGRVYLAPFDTVFGAFSIDRNGLWVFASAANNLMIETGNRDLIKAEMKVFKQLVTEQVIRATP